MTLPRSHSTLSSPFHQPVQPPDPEALQRHFLSILPRIETHARIHFRHLRCLAKREDAVAEVVALAWSWYVKISKKGKDAGRFVSALADFAVRQVRSGRRLCGQERTVDALSSRAQRQKGFRVESLSPSTRHSHETLYGKPHGQDEVDALEERLCDNTVSPPDEQAAFRIDFPRWLSRLGVRNGRIAKEMALDHSTRELAARHQFSQGRISQLRREFHTSWLRYHAKPAS